MTTMGLRPYLGEGEIAIRIEEDPDAASRAVVFLEMDGRAAKLSPGDAAELAALLALAAGTAAQGRTT